MYLSSCGHDLREVAFSVVGQSNSSQMPASYRLLQAAGYPFVLLIVRKAST